MGKHLIIAALAAMALAVTGCRSFDTEPSHDNRGRAAGAPSEVDVEQPDEEAGTGGSGARGGSGSNDLSVEDPADNRGEDLPPPAENEDPDARQLDIPPDDARLHILRSP